MKVNKINKETITTLIQEEAAKYKRRKELFDSLMEIEKELEYLNEHFGVAGTFGFVNSNDKTMTTKSGFVNTPNISYISQLAKDFGMTKEEMQDENIINEVESLRKENEKLKEKLASFNK
jgi:hypothetical protein